MKTLWLRADRSLLEIVHVQNTVSLRRAALCVMICGAWYGAALGAYGIDGARWPQMLFAALKLPLLLALSGVLSLPLFAVLYALWGLHDEFTLILRALLRTQAVFAIVLAALSPLLLLVYASIGDIARGYNWALGANFVLFGIAGAVAQTALRADCRELLKHETRHRWLLGSWMWVYGFVGVQMAWVLRPFIGDPHSATAFFRSGALSNAYIALWNLLF